MHLISKFKISFIVIDGFEREHFCWCIQYIISREIRIAVWLLRHFLTVAVSCEMSTTAIIYGSTESLLEAGGISYD